MPLLAKTGNSLSKRAEPANSRRNRSTTQSWSSAKGGTAVAKAANRGFIAALPDGENATIPFYYDDPSITIARGGEGEKGSRWAALLHAIPGPAQGRRLTSSVRKAIKLRCVLTGDLVDLLGGQLRKLFFDELVRFRPDAV